MDALYKGGPQSANLVQSTPALLAIPTGHESQAAAGGSYFYVPAYGANTAVINLSGTWSASPIFEGSLDGTIWFTINGYDVLNQTPVNQPTVNGTWICSVSGMALVRVRLTAWVSGTVVVTIGVGAGNSLNFSVPCEGTVQQSNSGTVAPGQSLKQFASNGGILLTTLTVANVYTVTPLKIFYPTDIRISTDQATSFLIQIFAGSIVLFEDWISTTCPLLLSAIESQAGISGGTLITLQWATQAGKHLSYAISGFEK
jgi:hypothetical protein